MRISLRYLAWFFAAGAVAGTLGDCFHTHFGVVQYPHPWILREAWWVPLLMGAAGVSMGTGHEFLRARNKETGRSSARDVALAFTWFIVIYAISAIFSNYGMTLAIGFTAAFVARALSRPPSGTLWFHAITVALGGLFTEAVLTRLGVFRYTHPDVVGVAIWLPGLYLHTALFAREIDRYLGADRAA